MNTTSTISFRHNNFDLLRLFAASQVAFLHIALNLDVQLDGGLGILREWLLYFPGVPVFYVISGFLISASLDRNPNVREYALNRFLRIYPALWAATLITLLLLVVLGDRIWETMRAHGDSPASVVGSWLLAQFTVAQFYNPYELKINYGVGHLNGSLWTIPVELQFYLLLPVVAAMVWRRAPSRLQEQGRLLLMLVLAYVISLAYQQQSESIREIDEDVASLLKVSLIPYFYMFVLGIILQRNFERIRQFVVGKGHWWLIAYLCTAYFFNRVLGVSMASSTPHIVPMLLLALATVSLAFTKPQLSEKLLRGNDISYGTYIYHMIVANAAFELGYAGTTSSLFVVLLVTYVVAFVSWVAVERPALALKRHPLFSRVKGGSRETKGPSVVDGA